MKYCKRGHPQNERNYYVHVDAAGRKQTYCRPCAAYRAKLRYRVDVEYREAEKERTRNNYRKGRGIECSA